MPQFFLISLAEKYGGRLLPGKVRYTLKTQVIIERGSLQIIDVQEAKGDMLTLFRGLEKKKTERSKHSRSWPIPESSPKTFSENVSCLRYY